MIDVIKRVRVNFYNEDHFNVLFYLTNLYWSGVTNKKEIAKSCGTNGADRSRGDRKKADRSGTTVKDRVAEELASEDLKTVLEDPILENLSIRLEDPDILSKYLALEDPSIV